jgi:hypothetical protein
MPRGGGRVGRNLRLGGRRAGEHAGASAEITVSYSASRTMPGKCSHSCPGAAFLPTFPLALFFMAASPSYPTRSSGCASIGRFEIAAMGVHWR